MKTSDFQNKWNSFRGQSGCLQRLDPNHPMDFFIGISDKGYDELALFTQVEPALLNSSQALKIIKNKRKDGIWATQIYSVDSCNQDIFARLCLDLVECSQSCQSEVEGLKKVTKRYLAWEKLFAKLKETLPMSVIKGLVGELDFLKTIIQKGYSKDDAVAAWLGPEGADRDFILNNTWFENKAIATGKSYVRISSLNQLETEQKGYLSTIQIDESTHTDQLSFSVKSYINEMRNILSDAPSALTMFEQKLISVGYIDKDIYDNIYLSLGNREYYIVDDQFPKLTTNGVPKEIIQVSYDISIVGIQPWKIGEEEVWN